MATGADRRQRERAPLRTVAQVILAGSSPVGVRTIDISSSGIGIVSMANPPQGLKCAIRVALPIKPKGTTTIELQARVAHSVFSGKENGFVIGLQFMQLSAEAGSAIERFLHT